MRKLLAILLSFLMAVSGVAPAVTEQTDDDFVYVSFGSSSTVGYGLHGFVPDVVYDDPTIMYADEGLGGTRDGFYSSGYYNWPDGCYPQLIADKLQAYFGESTTVDFRQCAINSFRSYELLYVLDENRAADAYVNWRFADWMEDLEEAREVTFSTKVFGEASEENPVQKAATDLRAEFRQNVIDADLITYDLGVNDFGVYLSNRISTALTNGRENAMYDADMSLVLDEVSLANYNTFRDLALELIIKEYGQEVDENTRTDLTLLADTLAYALIGFISNFDATMEIIYDLNPDVEIVVVSIQNLMKDYTLEYNGQTIAFGDIFGAMIDIANAYTAYVSPYANNYYYANVSENGRQENFIDDITSWDGEDIDTLSDSIKEGFDVWEKKFQVRSLVSASVQQTVNEAVESIPDALLQIEGVEDFVEGLGDDLTDEICDGIYYALAKAIKTAAEEPVISLEGAAVANDVVNALTTLATGDGGIAEQVSNNYTSNILNKILGLKTGRTGFTDEVQAYIDEQLDTILATDAAKSGLVVGLVMSFGNCYFYHMNEDGHEATAEIVWDAYLNKTSYRGEVAKTVADAIEEATADFRAEAKEAAEKVVEEIKQTDEEIKEAVEKAVEEIKEVPAEIKEEVKEAQEDVADKAEEAKEAAKKAQEEATEEVKDAFSGFFSNFNGSFLDSLSKLDNLLSLGKYSQESSINTVKKTFNTTKGEYYGKVVILHTNDVHGAIEGYSYVAALKAQIEAQGGNVILVDDGDYSNGNIYVSISQGASAVTLMDIVGYDIVTLGNHELDFGYDTLQENFANADFNVLCSNVIKDGESIFESEIIYQVGGLKIGFFSLLTPETQTKVNPTNVEGMTFTETEDLYAIAQAEADKLNEECDVVICLAHLGVADESEGNRSTDVLANTTGIDFIIDGHSHTVMTEGPDGEPIQSTGTQFENIGAIVIDMTTKEIESNMLIPCEGLEQDEIVLATAQNIIDTVDEQYGATFATSEVDLEGTKGIVRSQETNLGDLIADALIWTVTNNGSLEVDNDHVVAVTNGGGIRASIAAGNISRSDIKTVLPFGNTIAVDYVTGAELLEALEASTYCSPSAVGGFPQIAGMKITIDTTAEFDEGEEYPASTYHAPASIQRVTITEVNGQPFDPDATYAVVTNNFCAAGGDTYYAFKRSNDAGNCFDTSIPMDEGVVNYILYELGGVIGQEYAEPAGRITYIQ